MTYKWFCPEIFAELCAEQQYQDTLYLPYDQIDANAIIYEKDYDFRVDATFLRPNGNPEQKQANE